jgi:hypothetical protein
MLNAEIVSVRPHDGGYLLGWRTWDDGNMLFPRLLADTSGVEVVSEHLCWISPAALMALLPNFENHTIARHAVRHHGSFPPPAQHLKQPASWR